MKLTWHCLVYIAFFIQAVVHHHLVVAQIQSDDKCDQLVWESQETLNPFDVQIESQIFTFNKGIQMSKCIKLTQKAQISFTAEMALFQNNNGRSQPQSHILENNNIAFFVANKPIDPKSFDFIDFINNTKNYQDIICFSVDGLISRQLFPKLFCHNQIYKNSESLYIYFIYVFNLEKPGLNKNTSLSHFQQFSEIDQTEIQMKFVVLLSETDLNECLGSRDLNDKNCICKNNTMITQYCNVEATHIKEFKENLIVSPNKDGIIQLYIYSKLFKQYYREDTSLELSFKFIDGNETIIYFQEFASGPFINEILPLKLFYNQQKDQIFDNRIPWFFEGQSSDIIISIICMKPIILNFKMKIKQNPSIPDQNSVDTTQKDQGSSQNQSDQSQKGLSMIWIITIILIVIALISALIFFIKKKYFNQKKSPKKQEIIAENLVLSDIK